MANSCMPYLIYILLFIFNPWATSEIIELLVLNLNDYYYKNHMKEGEEKYQTFFCVIRSIMSENLNLKLSEFKLY